MERETSPFSNAVQVLDPEVAVDVQPPEIDFADVAIGTTREASLSIQNTGSSSLSIEVQPALDFTGNGFVRQEAERTFTLGPGASRSVSVRLTPGSQGQRTSTLSILHNAGKRESPLPLG